MHFSALSNRTILEEFREIYPLLAFDFTLFRGQLRGCPVLIEIVAILHPARSDDHPLVSNDPGLVFYAAIPAEE